MGSDPLMALKTFPVVTIFKGSKTCCCSRRARQYNEHRAAITTMYLARLAWETTVNKCLESYWMVSERGEALGYSHRSVAAKGPALPTRNG